MMNKFNIFIDESGSSNPANWQQSPFFTLCGLVNSHDNRDKLKSEVENIKLKYFGTKNYVLHSVELNRHLNQSKKIESFAVEIEKIIKNNSFFLLYVVVDLCKAHKRSWQSATVYKNSYSILLGNLIKFLIAKKVSGRVCAEASSVHQDIFLYQSFFNYISQGISRLDIKPQEVKKHLTEVSFVTKLNNDPEEQLADLFSVCGRMKVEIDRGDRHIESLTPITKVLVEQMDKKLFKGNQATNSNKRKMYGNMNSFVLLP